MSRKTVLITGAAPHERALQLIDSLGYRFVRSASDTDETTLKSLVADIDPVALLVRAGSISAAVVAAAPSLRVISKHGVGTDNIDIAAATSRGIPVVVTIGANAQSVAEHSLALMLAVVKDLLPLDKSIREGRWDKSSFMGRELRGMNLGLVGFGAIAQRFAPLAQAMEMSVRAYDPFIPGSEFKAANVDHAEHIDILLRNADVVSLHCPLTEKNRKFLNTSTIASMKRGSFVINTARGGLIDETALFEALKTGQIAAAGLDTLASEPPREAHPFFGLSNVVLTPHIAGCTEKSMERVGTDAVQGIHAVLSGEELPPGRVVNTDDLTSAEVAEANKQAGPGNID